VAIRAFVKQMWPNGEEKAVRAGIFAIFTQNPPRFSKKLIDKW
jgi:hypothetical protein